MLRHNGRNRREGPRNLRDPSILGAPRGPCDVAPPAEDGQLSATVVLGVSASLGRDERGAFDASAPKILREIRADGLRK